jgi:electron transport complex protein RnfG
MISFYRRLPPLLQRIILSGLMLGGFALISTSLLSLTNLATKEAIAESERQSLLKNLIQILPPELFDNDLLQSSREFNDILLGHSKPARLYRAKKAHKTVAIIISTQAPNGYNGRIKLLVGVMKDGSIAGVRVSSHRETPGLGDDIELSKSEWVLSFNGHSLKNTAFNQWRVKKDGGIFDQFTGATITPRAVVKSLASTLLYVEKNHHSLFTENEAVKKP